jgi:hypothetical protein
VRPSRRPCSVPPSYRRNSSLLPPPTESSSASPSLSFEAAPRRIRLGLEHRLVRLRPTGGCRRQRQRRAEPDALPGRIWTPHLPLDDPHRVAERLGQRFGVGGLVETPPGAGGKIPHVIHPRCAVRRIGRTPEAHHVDSEGPTAADRLTRRPNNLRHPHGIRRGQHHPAPPFSTAPRRRFHPPSTGHDPCSGRRRDHERSRRPGIPPTTSAQERVVSRARIAR